MECKATDGINGRFAQDQDGQRLGPSSVAVLLKASAKSCTVASLIPALVGSDVGIGDLTRNQDRRALSNCTAVRRAGKLLDNDGMVPSTYAPNIRPHWLPCDPESRGYNAIGLSHLTLLTRMPDWRNPTNLLAGATKVKTISSFFPFIGFPGIHFTASLFGEFV
jgi:hypothetical protein